MRRFLAAARTAWTRYWAAYDVRAALAAHRAMGHSCSFCRAERE